MSVGTKVAKVQVWFSRELPVNALIGLKVLRALSISMFPVDEGGLGEVAVKTSKRLRPSSSIVLGSVHLCALVREHQAHTRNTPSVASDRPSLDDPFVSFYDVT